MSKKHGVMSASLERVYKFKVGERSSTSEGDMQHKSWPKKLSEKEAIEEALQWADEVVANGSRIRTAWLRIVRHEGAAVERVATFLYMAGVDHSTVARVRCPIGTHGGETPIKYFEGG